MPTSTTARLRSVFLVFLFCLASTARGFALRVDGVPADYSITSRFLLPDTTLTLETSERGEYAVHASPGTAQPKPIASSAWSWRAPSKPGLYSITVHREDSDEEMRVQAFVMVPSERMKGESLNGYRLGRYPTGGTGAYASPRGFIEVTRENEDALVAPHFKLKQFLCKQTGVYPKYLVLSERLLTKLEMLLAKVNEHGFNIPTFHVMSGYRTPAYNHGLGNVKLSRHQFGDAADIYIEDPHTGQMADLNHDGKVDAKDAMVLYSMVRELTQSHPDRFPIGGAGTYEATKAHGPFLHVDARGFTAKWGTITDERKPLPKS